MKKCPPPHLPPWSRALPNISPTANTVILLVVVFFDKTAAIKGLGPIPLSFFYDSPFWRPKQPTQRKKKQTKRNWRCPQCDEEADCAGTGGRLPRVAVEAMVDIAHCPAMLFFVYCVLCCLCVVC